MFRVIMDASPATRGHSLILPKEHYANIYELPDDVAAETFVLAKKMADRMSTALDCDGFNLIQNNGECAGQTVFHFHLHLIPRYEDDINQGVLGWVHEEFSEEEFDRIEETLKEGMPDFD